MVEGRDRRAELGYYRAMRLRQFQENLKENGTGDISPEELSLRDPDIINNCLN